MRANTEVSSSARKSVSWLFWVSLLLIALAWFGNGLGVTTFAFFGPKWENVESDAHRSSKAEGNYTDLENLCSEVMFSFSDDQPGRAGMLEAIIARDYANKAVSDVPNHLQSCLQKARSDQQ